MRKSLIPLRYRSAFNYEALRAGSLSEKTKEKYYDKLYKKLKRQANAFEKSEFADLEYQQSMVGELKPRSQLDDDELDAQLAMMASMEMQGTLSLSEMRREREEFYEDYADVLSDRFYKGEGKKRVIDPSVYNKFVNFVQVSHHTHLGELLADSDRVTHFKNIIGKERWEAMDSDELYTEFFDYLEEEEFRAREELSW